ncbi:MAG: DUF5343 domain-containing protein [Candidatus Sedimenticola sp. PURPLELP]
MAVLPYVTAPGNVKKALNGISEAATPDSVSQDFVKEILKIPGGSGTQMTAYLKKIGLANPDGTPTTLYKKFRNPDTRGAAAAEALKYGYSEIYKRNEYAHELTDQKLKGLILEITGLEHDSPTVTNTASCFKNIKSYASFNHVETAAEIMDTPADNEQRDIPPIPTQIQLPPPKHGVGLNLGYTINLNLPATSDIAVFNAIFKSLKENLLASDDE